MPETSLLVTYEALFGPFVHMGQADKAIWLRFLLQGGGRYAPFEYDVRVGNGTELPHDSDKMLQSISYALTTKRIDVICRKAGKTWIIEVKKRAGASAVGQLSVYRDLFQSDRPSEQNVGIWLITDVLQPDMELPLVMAGIKVTVVGE